MTDRLGKYRLLLITYYWPVRFCYCIASKFKQNPVMPGASICMECLCFSYVIFFYFFFVLTIYTFVYFTIWCPDTDWSVFYDQLFQDVKVSDIETFRIVKQSIKQKKKRDMSSVTFLSCTYVVIDIFTQKVHLICSTGKVCCFLFVWWGGKFNYWWKTYALSKREYSAV